MKKIMMTLVMIITMVVSTSGKNNVNNSTSTWRKPTTCTVVVKPVHQEVITHKTCHCKKCNKKHVDICHCKKCNKKHVKCNCKSCRNHNHKHHVWLITQVSHVLNFLGVKELTTNNFPYFRKLRNYSWRKVAFEYVQFVWKYNVFSANTALFSKNANLFSLSISTARSDEPVIVVPVVVKTRPTVCHAV